MSNLFDILNTVNVALKDPTGFDWSEIDKAMIELHAKLTEPKWAIEDENLRGECEKLVISWAAKSYLANAVDDGSEDGKSGEKSSLSKASPGDTKESTK